MTARRHALPLGLLASVVIIAVVLLLIGLRSPYTHHNLSSAGQAEFNRTALSRIGRPEPLPRFGPSSAALPSDPVARGRTLYVTEQCATCHGLEGRGAATGPPILGTNAETLHEKALKGPGGMPSTSPDALSDTDYQAIATYLKSLVKT